MTRAEVRFLLARVAAAYGRRPPEAHVVDEWHRALGRHPAAHVYAALDVWIAEGRPGPNVAQLVATVRDPGPPQPRAVPDPLPWGGPTARGRELIAKARSALRRPPTPGDEP